jgi:hypothetical protein
MMNIKANPKSLNVFFSIDILVIVKFIFSSKRSHMNRFKKKICLKISPSSLPLPDKCSISYVFIERDNY